jgi:hypothetical protein
MMSQGPAKLGRVITRTRRLGLRLTPQLCRSGARHWFSSTTKADVVGKKEAKKVDGSLFFFRAGLPLVLFSCLGVWVVSNGIQGKLKERDAFTGSVSKYVELCFFSATRHLA